MVALAMVTVVEIMVAKMITVMLINEKKSMVSPTENIVYSHDNVIKRKKQILSKQRHIPIWKKLLEIISTASLLITKLCKVV
jgi:hypothetical protein